MRRNINQEVIEGRVFEHDLALKTVQNQQSENFGKEFINGSISVATDEAGLNVLTVHYTYVTEFTKQGKPNATYSNLKKIIEGKTWVKDGKDEAIKVRLSTSAALNDFYPQGNDELVSQPRNEGGFVSIMSNLNPEGINRQKFTFDTIITGVSLVEKNPENNIAKDYVKIKCVIFNFKNEILPFTLVAKSEGAINYFLNLDASPSNPIYTQVWGEIVNTTVVVTKTVESAFGEPETITVEELNEAIANRNVYLEEVKTRAKEYYASRNNSNDPLPFGDVPSPTKNTNTTIPVGEFKF